MDKTCRLINDKFSYILEVDGYSISFQGHSSFLYFKELYAGLGYNIVTVNNSGCDLPGYDITADNGGFDG